jgi:hypothetical protein
LLEAARALEQSTAGPAADPEWRVEVDQRLSELAAAIAEHIDETEGPDGLLEEILGVAPRLANAISRLRAEHDDLGARVVELRDRLASDARVDEMRGDILSLLMALSHHRQRGSDLVYEAYKIDIGGG